VAQSFFSPSWYRVAQLVPELRAHLRTHRHVYRGQIWYVLEDRASRRSHRLTSSAYLLASLMNGHRTVEEIWSAAGERLGDDTPSQDEMIRLLGLLHQADAIRCDVTPDTAELLARCQRREQSEWWQRYANPLSIKLPLGDPDAWLSRVAPHAARFYCWPVAILALLVMLAALLVAARHWAELSADASANLLAPSNLPILLLAYPLMKALHELGHALTTKVYGGEVHEMGVIFLVMMPLPYVDASSAGVWPEKSRRIAVGAAGIFVEILLSALSILVWANVDPGFLRTLAFDIAWIGAASSLFVNGNPLLRFDGYYVLSDAIEIPNLRQRASQYLQWLLLARAFGASAVRNPLHTSGEQPWLLGFGLASFVYRLFILLLISLFLLDRFFVLGTLLAVFAVITQVVVPLARGLRFLAVSPRLGQKRTRAIGLTAGTVITFLLIIVVIPLPLHTRAQGVVWPPEGAHVRAQADGFVVEVLASPGSEVSPGQPLFRTRDAALETALEVEKARLQALLAREHAERVRDRVQARIVADEIEAARAAVAHARERVGEVVVSSPSKGEFVVPGSSDLIGRFVRQGELLGYVVGDVTTTARVVLSQDESAWIRERLDHIEVRSVVGEKRVWPARLRREVPGSSDRLPSAALGSSAGGPIPVDPSDSSGLTPLDSIFQLDLELPSNAFAGGIGSRVYVRFDHGAEPFAFRLLRAVQRLFLGRIGG
jgi:putative peptide zinc metalloprotease protein